MDNISTFDSRNIGFILTKAQGLQRMTVAELKSVSHQMESANVAVTWCGSQNVACM